MLLEEVVASIGPTRVLLKSGTSSTRTRSSGERGFRASPIAHSLGLELQRGNRIAAEPDLSLAGYPEVFPVGDIAWITDTKKGEVLPQLGSVALQAGVHAGENITLSVDGKERALPLLRQGDDGDDRPRCGGHPDAAGTHPQGQGGVAGLGHGPSRLLSTGEDRAKAMADWTWEEFTKERPGRITVKTEEVG